MARTVQRSNVPCYLIGNWLVGARVDTDRGSYTGDTMATRQRRYRERVWVVARRLVRPADRQRAEGELTIDAQPTPATVRLTARAEVAGDGVRALSVVLRDLPRGEVLGPLWRAVPLGEGELALPYPQELHTPLIFVRLPGDAFLYFRAAQRGVWQKRFWAAAQRERLTIELEHPLPTPTSSAQTPEWHFGVTAQPERVVAEHCAQLERALGLRPWEKRDDVPQWAREIALVDVLRAGAAADSRRVPLDALRSVVERLGARRVLVLVEGQGEETVGTLCRKVQEAGCPAMLTVDAESLGRPTADGAGWARELGDAAARVARRFRPQALLIRGVRFADAADHDALLAALAEAKGRLRQEFPELLLACHGWRDVLGAIFPLLAARPPERWPAVFSRYCRCFDLRAEEATARQEAASATGDRGPEVTRACLPALLLPTADAASAQGRVERALARAEEYARRFL